MSVPLRYRRDLDAEAWVLTEKPGQRLLAEVTEVLEPRPADITRWRKLAPRMSSPPRSGWPPAGPGRRRNSPVAIGCGSTPSASSKQPARQCPHKAGRFACPLVVDPVRGSAATRWHSRKRLGCWLWIATTECAVDSPGTPPFTTSRTASYLASRGPRHSRFRRGPGSTLIPIAEPRDTTSAMPCPLHSGPGVPPQFRATCPGGAINLSPASDFAAHSSGPEFEVELISLRGECKEATVWFRSSGHLPAQSHTASRERHLDGR